jgi:hypothetical protein
MVPKIFGIQFKKLCTQTKGAKKFFDFVHAIGNDNKMSKFVKSIFKVESLL